MYTFFSNTNNTLLRLSSSLSTLSSCRQVISVSLSTSRATSASSPSGLDELPLQNRRWAMDDDIWLRQWSIVNLVDTPTFALILSLKYCHTPNIYVRTFKAAILGEIYALNSLSRFECSFLDAENEYKDLFKLLKSKTSPSFNFPILQSSE